MQSADGRVTFTDAMDGMAMLSACNTSSPVHRTVRMVTLSPTSCDGDMAHAHTGQHDGIQLLRGAERVS
jgi:hypothetical protein